MTTSLGTGTSGQEVELLSARGGGAAGVGEVLAGVDTGGGIDGGLGAAAPGAPGGGGQRAGVVDATGAAAGQEVERLPAGRAADGDGDHRDVHHHGVDGGGGAHRDQGAGVAEEIVDRRAVLARVL